MSRVYSVFANGGYLTEPYLIQRIEDADGSLLYEADPAVACTSCVIAEQKWSSDIVENDSLAKLPKQAARTLEEDIRPIADVTQATGVPIEACVFIGSSPIRQYAEEWDLEGLVPEVQSYWPTETSVDDLAEFTSTDELYERLPAEILQYTFTTVFTTPIVRSKHGDSSGVRGAAWLWAEDPA